MLVKVRMWMGFRGKRKVRVNVRGWVRLWRNLGLGLDLSKGFRVRVSV